MIHFFWVRRKERRDKGGDKWDEKEDYIVKGGRIKQEYSFLCEKEEKES